MVFVSTEIGGRGAAARGQFHQADEAALQCAAARRQELPVYPDHRRPCGAAAAQASRRAQRQGRLFRPVRQRRRGSSHARTRCSAPSCCAPAPTAFTRTARGLACSTRSSAARRPAPAKYRSTIIAAWSARRTTSCPAAAARFAIAWRPRWRRPPKRSPSRERRACATASRRFRRSRASRASIRKAFPRPTCSPWPRRRGSSASRCSSSAPTRTGATAPISRAPTAASAPPKCSTRFSRSSTWSARRRAWCCCPMTSRAATLREALSARAGRRIAIGAPRRGEKRELVDNAMRNAREALSRKLADAATQEKLLAALGAAFGVDHPIRRVEVYDNSHIMGTNAIGAMIVAGPEGFVKGQYRTFNIKSDDADAGRRLRDDARSARAPLRAASAQHGETAEARAPFPIRPISCCRRRARTVRGGAGSFRRARRRGRRRSSAIAKGPDRNAGRETFFVEGREPFRLAAARSGALFRAAAARRGASLRHRHASRASARRNSSRARSTKSPASGRRASGRCSTLSEPPRASPAPALPILKRRLASTRRPRGWCFSSFTRSTGVEPL